MNYETKNYEHLLGLSGITDVMLKNHLTLYAGYVTNTNKISDLLKLAKAGTPELNELKRRFGWEYNGMKMHELYFENLTKENQSVLGNGDLMNSIVKNFSSFENWLLDFRATGTMRGIGWVILTKGNNGELFNAWVGEHDLGQMVSVKPLLIMDVWEHAYMTDYGLKRADYIEAFIKNVDWQVVQDRFNK